MVVAMKTSSRWLSLLGIAIVTATSGVVAFSDDDGCISRYFADGDCDDRNNNAECGFDSGDCCACTCESTEDYTCGSNGYSCIDPDAACVDDDDITIGVIEDCSNPRGIGNGYCDMDNNKEECGFDGGDCCECTCTGRGDDDYSCIHGFACIDPDAPCVDDDDITLVMHENCGYVQGIGDGYCDDGNNKPECGYDGGDCCECTCVADAGSSSYGCSHFACIDPDAPCVDDDDITLDMYENCGYVQGIDDGYCDDENNKPECGYDGGDCCECTCVTDAGSSSSYRCMQFACIDPDAPCVDDDDITLDMYENCGYVQGIGDGYCDDENNKPECGYDGGDCCECTCVADAGSSSTYGCMQFACIDPDAPCVDDDDITLDMFEHCGYVADIGNGYCDQDNNIAECGYDGGDCCSCTCESVRDDDYSCSADAGFDCKDEAAPCFGEESTINGYDDDDEPLSFEFVPCEQDGDLPTVDGAVEVGDKTEVAVTATAYDVRPGASSGQVGCGDAGGNGCEPPNSRDGIVSEIESRWSCASKIVPDEGPCQIEYTFAEPQDIVDIQVAFWKGNERTRTLEVHFDGMLHHTHESYAGSTFNTLGVAGTGVTTVMLESIHLVPDEWISLIEVLIFVTP